MSTNPTRSGYGMFLERRMDLKADDDQIKADAMLGIGLLIGAGFSGAAAAVSHLLERQFPDEPWPWKTT